MGTPSDSGTPPAASRSGDGTTPPIVLAATFTADLLQPPLEFWLDELALDYSVEIAPYNQVFQELLQPQSLFSQNSGGVNVALIRWEDLGIRDGEEQNAAALLRAFQSSEQRLRARLLLLICPPSPGFAASNGPGIERWNAMFALALEGLPNIDVILPEQIFSWYPCAKFYDAYLDRLGHAPYTADFSAALATVIARRIDGLRRAPFKVIALDCDNTLWDGVVGEDGPAGVEIGPARKALQEFMVRQHEMGMLLTLCSKNNEADVDELFRLRQDMVLQKSHIISGRVNWNPKSSNLRALAAELDLGLDSFVFLDDSPAECAEVQANCPEVLTLQLPGHADELPAFLNHLWPLDHGRITADDKNRTRVYVQKLERERLEHQSTNIGEFIGSLGLEIDIAPLRPEQLPRVSQLTQRTNQFNITTIRRSELEIQDLLRSGFRCLTVDVRDRFGSYGLVGVAILKTTGEQIEVDSFLLSCRALGRGVEHAVVRHLGEMAAQQGLAQVKIPFRPTAKNTPARLFLEAIAGPYRQDDVSDGFRLALPASYAAQVTFQPGETISIPKEEAKPKKASAPLVHRADYARLASELRDPARIVQLMKVPKILSEVPAGFEPPQPGVEERLAGIWAEALRLPAIGRNHNFFEAGGDSLLAVQVLGRTIEEFALETLTLSSFLEAPTVAQFARLLSLGGRQEYHCLVCMRSGKDRPPFFCVHGGGGNVLSLHDLAMAMPEDLPFYCLQARGLDGGEPFTTVEETAAYYVSEIVKAQPQGPYYIGGLCYGGLVAFEMAREMVRQGLEVGLVVLVDTYNHAYGSLLPLHKTIYANLRFLSRRVAHHLGEFRKLSAKERSGYLADRVSAMSKHASGFLKLISGGAKTQVVGDLPIGVPHSVASDDHFRTALRRVAIAHFEAQGKYVPQPYAGRILLFRASERFVEPYEDSQLGWGVVAQGVDVFEIPGDHNQIIGEPSVRQLVAKLDEFLAKSADHAARDRVLVP